MYRILSFLLLLCPLAALALPDDDKQMMHIEANSSSFDYKNGVNTYEGKVKIDQGSTHLSADKLVTHNNDKHKLSEAIAYGFDNFAEYTTKTKPEDPELHARAKVIKYYPIEGKVELEGDVLVTQGENSFNGPVIIYNIKDQVVNAPASNNGRAIIVIDSKQLKS